MATAEGIDYLTSNSIQGTSTVTAYIRLNYDPSQALTDVMAKVQQVKYLLPTASEDPIILKSTGQTTAVMYIGFSSPDLSSAAISDYLTRVVQPLMSTVNGVASADILGGQTFAMRLWLDPARMAARGISATDVANAIRANNYQAAPGQTKGFFTVTNIDAHTGISSVGQFRRMVVKSAGGALVRVEDIAKVELSAQSWTSSVVMNGQHAVFIGVQATPTGNPLSLVTGVRKLMPEIERTLPPSVKMQVAYDSTKFIQSSINEVEVVARAGGGHRRRRDLPVPRQPALRGDPDRDDPSIADRRRHHHGGARLQPQPLDPAGDGAGDRPCRGRRDRRAGKRLPPHRRGQDPPQAALIGAREIAGPVIAMTLTLAAVYAPIGFLGGVTGTLFREFAFTLAGAVIISGIVAVTLSPMMCSLLLSHNSANGRFARLIDRVFTRLAEAYGRRLDRTLDYRPVTALFAIAIVVAMGFMYLNTKKELAPEEDQGVLFALTKAPQYSNLDYSDYYGAELDKAFTSIPETDLRFVLNGRFGPNQGIAGVILKPWDERSRSALQT